ncbi:MAG TPA: hypothetical protein VLE97_05720 [Gaiellaceae bacterium]|nr:hypothetical protein [Gaiellaceae bacterium]
MANITEEHLHHMARRHHATMKKLDGLRERFAGITGRFTATIETGAGAWLGGAIEGRTGGKTLGPVPYNLGAGLLLVAAGHWAGSETQDVSVAVAARSAEGAVFARQHGVRTVGYGDHFNNLGNGLIGSWLAATGYAWGKKWKETGKLFGHHSWSQAYENQPGGGGVPSPGPQGGPPPPTSGWYHG